MTPLTLPYIHLADLARAVCDATVPLGFEPETRRFHPHVTLARLRKPKSVDALLAVLGEHTVGRPFPVSELA